MRTLLTAAAILVALSTTALAESNNFQGLPDSNNKYEGQQGYSGRQTYTTNTQMWRALNAANNPFSYTELQPTNRTIRAFAEARHIQKVWILDFMLNRDGKVTGVTPNNCGNC